MERRLLAELQSSSSSDDQLTELYSRVSDLRAHVILNYLAVLKITKKHIINEILYNSYKVSKRWNLCSSDFHVFVVCVSYSPCLDGDRPEVKADRRLK